MSPSLSMVNILFLLFEDENVLTSVFHHLSINHLSIDEIDNKMIHKCKLTMQFQQKWEWMSLLWLMLMTADAGVFCL